MKKAGYVLIIIGFALVAFVIYSFLRQSNKILSPIPYDDGVTVIFVTPEKK